MFLTLLVDILITSNWLKKSSFEIWKKKFQLFWRSSIFKSTEIASKVYKIHGTIFFMESNHISIFGVNISSNELGQVTLLNFDKAFPNTTPPLWLHHIWTASQKNLEPWYAHIMYKQHVSSTYTCLRHHFHVHHSQMQINILEYV